MMTPSSANFLPRSPLPGMRGQEEMLDQWMEGFQKHEQILAAMAEATLDQSFKEELATIEQWFTVLSEPERTATAYTLLQHSNLSQLKFFMSVLQQMIRTVEGQCMSPAFTNQARKPQSKSNTLRPPRLSLPGSSPSSPARDSYYNTPSTAVDAPPNFPEKKRTDFPDFPDTPQELLVPGRQTSDMSWANLVPTPQFNMFPRPSEKQPSPSPFGTFGVLNQFSLNTPTNAAAVTQETQMLALQLMMNGLMKPGQAVENIPKVPAMSEPPKPRARAPAAAAPAVASTTTNNWRAAAPANGRYASRGTGARGSGSRGSGQRGGAGATAATPLTEEGFDPRMLTDIPGWLKSLRLHKYTVCFESMPWQEMIMLTEEQLEGKGVTALGARRRMMKMFEVARKKMGMEMEGDGEEVSPSMDVPAAKTPSPAAPTVALRA